MASKINIDLSNAPKIISKLGLNAGGKAQLFFTNELMRISDPYVPFKQGALKNSARIVEQGTAIEYNTPYARYQWYGKVMVGSKPKVVTDRDLVYRGGALRGKMWVARAFNDNKQMIIDMVERSMKK